MANCGQCLYKVEEKVVYELCSLWMLSDFKSSQFPLLAFSFPSKALETTYVTASKENYNSLSGFKMFLTKSVIFMSSKMFLINRFTCPLGK